MIRWVVNPVDEQIGEDGRTYRAPRVATLGYTNSSVIMTANWCVSFVRADDFTAMDADPQCINLLETDYNDSDRLPDKTVGDLGWSAAKRQRVLAKMEARGVDTSGYTLATPLHRILRDLGRRLDVNLQDIRDLWVAGPGAPVLLRGTPRDLADDPGDSFVEASTTTALTAHTPTGSDPGTGWTEEERTGTQFMRVNQISDRAEASSAEANMRCLYTMQPNPSGAEYDVQVALTTVSTITTTPVGLLARLTDANNFYSAGTYRINDTNDKRIFKEVGGTVTQLATGDSGIANGDVLLFEIRDATKKLYKNGSLELSSSDNVLTSAGRAGLFLGNVWTAADDIGALWALQNFSYTMVAPSTIVASENYRTTLGAATDVSPDVHVTAAGWTNENNTVDGSGVGDARLFGAVYKDNSTPQATRTITLPAAGTYTIRLALGFSGGSQPYQYLQVLDNTTPVLTIDKPAGTPNQNWYDATGTLKDQATWTSTYATSGVACSFSSTTLVIVLGSPTAQSPSSTLAHFQVEIGGSVAAATSLIWRLSPLLALRGR